MYQTKSFITKELEQRLSSFGSQVTTTADHLRTIADQLRQDELTSSAAGLAASGANTLDGFGRYLQSGSVDALAAGAEDFGRTRPLTLMTVAFALGVVGSRLLRASAVRRFAAESDDAWRDDNTAQNEPSGSGMSV